MECCLTVFLPITKSIGVKTKICGLILIDNETMPKNVHASEPCIIFEFGKVDSSLVVLGLESGLVGNVADSAPILRCGVESNWLQK
jgi:hypothetical protein